MHTLLIVFIALLPPNDFLVSEVITATYLAMISWVTPYIVMDKETYTVQYSIDISLQNSREVVIEANNGLPLIKNSQLTSLD